MTNPHPTVENSIKEIDDRFWIRWYHLHMMNILDELREAKKKNQELEMKIRDLEYVKDR